MRKKEALNRNLTFWPLVFIGLAFMTAMIIFTTYGIVAQVTNGLVPVAYIIVLSAMFFNVYSYGKMVQVYPSAGSAYSYSQKSIHPSAGFFVGWAIMMDYLLTPMLNYLVASIYLATAFPMIPTWVWIIAFVLTITVINLLGIKIAKNINILLVTFQILVILIFCGLAINQVLNGFGTGSIFTSLPFYNSDTPLTAIVSGASILFLSFLGFDTITTFSEETINPKKTIPKAMYTIVVIAAFMFITVSYVLYIVHPDFNNFTDVDAAGFEIVAAVTSSLFTAVFLAGYIMACFASALVSHGGISRFLYAMGRDGVLPKKVFGKLSASRKVPFYNIIIVGIISLFALAASVETILAFINFGVLIAFTFVNISVIAHYFVRQKRRNSIKEVILFLVLPLIGGSINLFLWINLDKRALFIGVGWLVIGFIYLCVLTKFFKKPIPTMNFKE